MGAEDSRAGHLLWRCTPARLTHGGLALVAALYPVLRACGVDRPTQHDTQRQPETVAERQPETVAERQPETVAERSPMEDGRKRSMAAAAAAGIMAPRAAAACRPADGSRASTEESVAAPESPVPSDDVLAVPLVVPAASPVAVEQPIASPEEAQKLTEGEAASLETQHATENAKEVSPIAAADAAEASPTASTAERQPDEERAAGSVVSEVQTDAPAAPLPSSKAQQVQELPATVAETPPIFVASSSSPDVAPGEPADGGASVASSPALPEAEASAPAAEEVPLSAAILSPSAAGSVVTESSAANGALRDQTTSGNCNTGDAIIGIQKPSTPSVSGTPTPRTPPAVPVRSCTGLNVSVSSSAFRQSLAGADDADFPLEDEPRDDDEEVNLDDEEGNLDDEEGNLDDEEGNLDDEEGNLLPDNDGDAAAAFAAEEEEEGPDGYLPCAPGDTIGGIVPSADLGGAEVQRYLLIKQLGSGQSSRVWLALDRSIPLRNYYSNMALQQQQQQTAAATPSHAKGGGASAGKASTNAAGSPTHRQLFQNGAMVAAAAAVAGTPRGVVRPTLSLTPSPTSPTKPKKHNMLLQQAASPGDAAGTRKKKASPGTAAAGGDDAKSLDASLASSSPLASSAGTAALPTRLQQPQLPLIFLPSPFVAIKICRCEESLVDCVEYELALHRFLEDHHRHSPLLFTAASAQHHALQQQQQQQQQQTTGGGTAAVASGAAPRGVSATHDYFLQPGPYGQYPCVALEILGVPLDHLMRAYDFRGIADLRIVKAVVRSMLDAVATLHAVHMMHLDLKPENLLLGVASAGVQETMRLAAAEYQQRTRQMVEVEAAAGSASGDATAAPTAAGPESALSRSDSSTHALQTSSATAGSPTTTSLSSSSSTASFRRLSSCASSLAAAAAQIDVEYAVKIVDLGLSYLVPRYLRPLPGWGPGGAVGGTLGGARSPPGSLGNGGSSSGSPRRLHPHAPVVSAAAQQHLAAAEEHLLSHGNYHKGTVVQTREYRAPEIILGSDFTTSTDMWSVGCIAYELLTGTFLFDPKVALGVHDENDVDPFLLDMQHLRDMQHTLGTPPLHWLRQQQGVHTQTFFSLRTGLLEGADTIPPRKELVGTLRPKFETDRECGQFLDFLFSCVQWDKAKRKTAVQLLQHEWLTPAW